jgi:CO dehydrogenase nickel-insertion accessory protein CooC1
MNFVSSFIFEGMQRAKKGIHQLVKLPYANFVCSDKVIDSSDVLCIVLDARDPEGTRTRHVEQYLRKEAPHKHVVFILNKVDLIPSRVAVSANDTSFAYILSMAPSFSQDLVRLQGIPMDELCYNDGKAKMHPTRAAILAASG